MRTPWGFADTVYRIATGVTGVSTPSHGGILVDASVFDLDERLRKGMFTPPYPGPDGYGFIVPFEEDCDAAALIHVHPELLAPAIASGYFGEGVTAERIAAAVSRSHPGLITQKATS